MSYELELTKTNRLRLARAFQHHKRVDYGIDCVIEDQMGRALVDDLYHPTAFCIAMTPFYYFAGDASGSGGRALLRDLPAYNLLMPSPHEWIAAAQEQFQDQLQSFTRYRFSAEQLSETHLVTLLDNSPYCDQIVPLDAGLIERWTAQPSCYLDIDCFVSPADFLERGLGYAALDGTRVMGVAYSSLICSRGIEVSLYVSERYRERGVATALASRLLLTCQHQGMRPNWDAANLESYKLAKKLGYVFLETYEAYYHSAE